MEEDISHGAAMVKLPDSLRKEMVFYATTGDYSDAERYERFARGCALDEKAFEIGALVARLAGFMRREDESIRTVEIVETASATGLTAVGVMAKLALEDIAHVYTSLDIEKNLLDYAESRGRGHRFVRGDFEDLPFPDESFHIYIMMGAEGLRSKGTFYPEVYRVLKRGGYYVMPQIGPRPVVRDEEKQDAADAGLILIRTDDYLVAKKE